MLGLPYNYLAGENLMQNTLSSGLEDYIETIYIASEGGNTQRCRISKKNEYIKSICF